jgi:hypothetical protein
VYIGTQPHSFIYVLSVATSALWQQNGVVMTYTAWPGEPKICALEPFAEKVCRLLAKKELCGLQDIRVRG